MYKVFILTVIAICSLAFSQPGKSGHGEKGSKSGKSNSSKGSVVKFDNKHTVYNYLNVALSEQKGKGDKGKKGGPKNQQGAKGGNSGHGSFKGQSKPLKHAYPQEKGNKGNKQKGHHPAYKVKKGSGHSGTEMQEKKYKGHSGKIETGHYTHGKKGKGHMVKYAKGHPNFGYLYINTPGYYSYRNYGQYRSHQAKMKHKKYRPVYEYQAVEGFNLIVVRNNFLFSETKNKIVLVREGLTRQRNEGIITVVEYDTAMERVYVLEQRRAAVEVNINL